jgi:tripartite-type tricarboxylate transporter receptor subunit TctC
MSRFIKTLGAVPALTLTVTLGLITALPAAAQPYPNKPVKIIVPFGPGGAADSLPRLVGGKLSEMWGQPVVIENRTGAAGNIGMDAGAKAAPDGYTLTSAPVGNLAVNPHMYKLGYDVFKDFTPITLLGSVQNVLVINPSVPANTLAELIALAKAQPGKLTFGSGGAGSQAHIGIELIKAQAGIDMVHVAYKGVGDSIKDLLGGQISMVLAQIPAVKPLIDSGKLRALGVASLQRTPSLPNVPTIAEAGNLKGFEAVSWYALVGPAGMPKEAVAKIQADSYKALQLPEIRERLLGFGADPVGSTPETLAAAIRSDYDRYGAIIRKLGIKAE